jgi:hypothetical protein
MLTPVAPNGAHSLLQQSPQSVHSTPSTPLQKAGPEGGAPQLPTFLPLGMSQVPLQQSLLRAHTSPG